VVSSIGLGYWNTGFCHRRFLQHRRNIGIGCCYHRFLKHKQDIVRPAEAIRTGFWFFTVGSVGFTLDILDLNYVSKKK
jgi:hypothetical protein